MQLSSQITRLKRAVPGSFWPGIVPPPAAAALAMQYQLERSQWLSWQELQRLQLQQLTPLVRHAARSVPYYATTLGDLLPADREPLSEEQFHALPILNRAQIQEAGTELHATRVPRAHGRVASVSTSGSTGRPLTALTTELSRSMWRAFTLREHLWRQRDFSCTLAAIRPELKIAPEEEIRRDGWGPSTDVAFTTGQMAAISCLNKVDWQAAWLQKLQPDYLLSLPSNLAALAEHALDNGWTLAGLKEVRAVGECCDDKLRTLCSRAWQVGVTDVYSASEVGYLALQCPQAECYHVQAESVFLEILNDDGAPCRPGEIGRVVVTPLHNFAMPLIRYELGDYAEVGEACPCGRGLPTIKRVLGRQRNMMLHPGGGKVWPSFPAEAWQKIGSVRQLQLVQTARTQLTVNYVARKELTETEEEQLAAALQQRLAEGLSFSFVRHDDIPRSPTGKYEDFICRVDAG
jgi:phenylacetate-CoA ligase